jgi:hypothetical protein
VDWHQDDRARPLVRQYQATLDSILQSQPELQGCVAYCAECEIRFLTHPRNAGRQNLRCPFGCRQHRRRQRSCQRSTAYYRTAAGRVKKKRLNARRQGGQVAPAIHSPSAADLQVPPAEPAREPLPAPAELRPEGVVLDESSVAHSPMLPYVRMVVSLITGVAFTCREVVHLLRHALRQHSIGVHRGGDYLLGFLHQRPP